MSRKNRRSSAAGPPRPLEGSPPPRPPDAPQADASPTPPRTSDATPRPRRSLFRREVETVENEPGYATASPWSLRGMLTLALVVVLFQVVVALITYELRFRNDPTDTLAFHMLNTDPVSIMLFALIGMPFARRLAQERRSMRVLETLSAGAIMYILDYVSISIAISASGHAADAHDGKQLAGAGVAAVLGIATGSALFGVIYRKLWMPRLPGSRPPR